MKLPALEELKQFACFVNWQYELTAKGEQTKVPINPVTGGKASSTVPGTWAPYAVAIARSPQIGFMLRPPFTGVDLDGCRNPETGAIAPAALFWIQKISAYTEVSPSRKGVKIWVRATLPPGTRNSVPFDWEKNEIIPRHRRKPGEKSRIEIFDHARYFTFTGEHLEGTPTTIEDRQAEIDELLQFLFPKSGREAAGSVHTDNSPSAGVLTLEEVDNRISGLKNRAKFRRLESGDWSGYDTQSEGDMAYAQLLAYACDCDKTLMAHKFRQSGLWNEDRAKQKARDYLERTIDKACEQQAVRYRPPRPRSQSAPHGHSHTHREQDHYGEEAAEPPAPESPPSEVEQLNSLVAHVFRTPELTFTDQCEWKGDVIRIKTESGWVEWPSSSDLGDFRTARALICAQVQHYLVPPETKPQVSWDRVARLIVNLARHSRQEVEHPAAEEVGDLITLLWNRMKSPAVAGSNEDIIRFIEASGKTRDPMDQDGPPPCVFIAEAFIYLIPGELKRWSSLPNIHGRDMAWPIMREGLGKLGFEQHILRRRAGGKKCWRRVWRASVHGPAGELLRKYVEDDPTS